MSHQNADFDELKSKDSSALVLHPDFKQKGHSQNLADPFLQLEEAVGLTRAIHLTVKHADVVPIRSPRPSTLFGKGAVENYTGLIAMEDIELVIVNGALSPIQQRNLEKAWKCKVIDRTGLILEIFGERARTSEGRLQVELAALTYQRSRLVRSWTHLERQRGGLGFVGGPGETQLEVDRRLIDERIAKLKRQISTVKRTRTLQREARARVPYPVVALVGYTNAGKSTLFNRLTNAQVLAKDVLFATLDPTMRALKLPSGRSVILSDTVGFISDLPTQLIAAFQATLEEVLDADLLLHVRDISRADTKAQKKAVLDVLDELHLHDAAQTRLVEVLNKFDQVPLEDHERWQEKDNAVCVSAIEGTGTDKLLKIIEDRLSKLHEVHTFTLDLQDGAALAWLYKHGDVKGRKDEDLQTHITVSLDPTEALKFRRQFLKELPPKENWED